MLRLRKTPVYNAFTAQVGGSQGEVKGRAGPVSFVTITLLPLE